MEKAAPFIPQINISFECNKHFKLPVAYTIDAKTRSDLNAIEYYATQIRSQVDKNSLAFKYLKVHFERVAHIFDHDENFKPEDMAYALLLIKKINELEPQKSLEKYDFWDHMRD